jgi:hypothetical protein
MQRRSFLGISSVLGSLGLLPVSSLMAMDPIASTKETQTDRAYWVELLVKMSSPILEHLSKGTFRKFAQIEFSPSWDFRNKEVAYMEAFGRLLVGLAPFVSLPDDGSPESEIRKKMRLQIQQSLAHGFDPNSPDYFYWGSPSSAQPLVDAAFISQALLSAPKVLWEDLSDTTKQHILFEFKKIRQIKPFNNNWVLFAAIIETFLLSVGEAIDAERIDTAIEKINKWYVGDGWYSDGDRFHFDHYNGYVIQPMLVDILKVNVAKGRIDPAVYNLAFKRMQRYSVGQERLISPEGTFPIIGRSSTYRVGAFQPLAKLALADALPSPIQPAQVRCALTAVFKRVFVPSTFTAQNLLTLGFIGKQQAQIADGYSNTGSMYITSFAFLPLGLPASHPFWAAPFTSWTQKKAWNGEPFEKDHAIDD